MTPSGEFNLAGFPLLCYAPELWGEGVRLTRTGHRVSELYLEVRDLVDMAEVAAHTHGITLAELFEAIRYMHGRP